MLHFFYIKNVSSLLQINISNEYSKTIKICNSKFRNTSNVYEWHKYLYPFTKFFIK